jgi:hypothetical protein
MTIRDQHSMARQEANERTEVESRAGSKAARAQWERRLALVTAVVFCVSSAFPAVAGFVTDTESWPAWWGRVDVGLAFLLAVLALNLISTTRERVDNRAEVASYRVYRLLTHGILAILIVFFVFGDRIIWVQCLSGFAWRTWLLLYSLPAWFTAFRAIDHPQVPIPPGE